MFIDPEKLSIEQGWILQICAEPDKFRTTNKMLISEKFCPIPWDLANRSPTTVKKFPEIIQSIRAGESTRCTDHSNTLSTRRRRKMNHPAHTPYTSKLDQALKPEESKIPTD